MFLANRHSDYRLALDPRDAETLSVAAAEEVERFLRHRENHVATPLHALPALAQELGVGAIHIKDEGLRLGLGSFKALGGSYAVIRLVLDAASERLDRVVDFAGLHAPDVRAIAAAMTFACATDGNHGRSVAQGARLVGARAVVFVHSGVSQERVDAIARFGAESSVWRALTIIPSRKRRESRSRMAGPSSPTHPGRGTSDSCTGDAGLYPMVREAHVSSPSRLRMSSCRLASAASRPRSPAISPWRWPIKGRCSSWSSQREPRASTRAHAPVVRSEKFEQGEPTVMAMLECYEPSLIAWRVLSRVADGFMMVEEGDAVAAMKRLARPLGADPAIVAGESGGVGLAGLTRALFDPEACKALHLGAQSRIFVINTEGATDPLRYAELVA